MIGFTFDLILIKFFKITTIFWSWCYLNYLDFVLLLALSYSVWQLSVNTNFRVKFIYFLLLLILVAVWGTFFSYDGIILVLLLGEFLIILLFLLIYLTYTFSFKTNFSMLRFFPVFFISICGLYLYNYPQYTFIFKFLNLYSFTLDMISSDFFIFFYFFFIEFGLITILFSFLLGLFSIIFIFFYFFLKQTQQHQIKNTKTTVFLRKQQLIHQYTYKGNLYIFQK